MTGTPVSRLPGAATFQITPDCGFSGPGGDEVAGVFPVGGTDTGNGNAPFNITADTAPENGDMRFTVDFAPEGGESSPDEFRLELVQFVGLDNGSFDPAGTLRAADGGAPIRDHLAADGSHYTMQFELDSPDALRQAFEFLFLPGEGLEITGVEPFANPQGFSDIFLQMDLVRPGEPSDAAASAMADAQSVPDPSRLLTVELRAGQLTEVVIPEPNSLAVLVVAGGFGAASRRRVC